MNYVRTLWMLAACVALVGCGGKAKKPTKDLKNIHRATASVLAEQVNSEVADEGAVLFVHRQAAEDLAQSWLNGLSDTLDDRFTLITYGLDKMSEESVTSFEGQKPVAEAMQNHGEAMVVISAIEFDPQGFRELPETDASLFALEWSSVAVAGPMLNADVLKAGIFEREQRIAATGDSSMEEIMAPRYLLATPENWQELIGQ